MSFQIIITKKYFSAMVLTKDKNILYTCTNKDDYRITKYKNDVTSSYWEKTFDMPRAYNDNIEYLLQLKLDRDEEMLLATTGNGFIVWFLEDKSDAHVLMLPNGVRNISTRMMCSNSIMVSGTRNYAVAGVRYKIFKYYCMQFFFYLNTCNNDKNKIIQEDLPHKLQI